MGNINAAVPKSMTRIREEWNGLPIRYVLVVIGFGILAMSLITGVLLGEGGQVIYLGLLFLVIFVFARYMRTPKVMERSVLVFKFFFRSLKGETIVAKFRLPDGFLEKIIPIKAFHTDGIIEFNENKYGLLMRVEPARVSEDDVDGQIKRTQTLLDSLYGELLIKTFVCSTQDTGSKPLARNVVNIINTQNRTPEQKKHLDSIYEAAQENTNAVIQWTFYIFLGIGKHDSFDKAQIAKKQYFPGFSAKVSKLGIHVIQLKTKESLAVAYRQCISQEGY